MKILWLAHRDPLNPKAGGAERIIYEVGRRLVKKDNTISIVSGSWQGCKKMEMLDGIHIMRFGYRLGPHLALPAILFKNKYDVIIADLGHAVPWICPVVLRKKVIVSFLHLHARSLPGQVTKLLAAFIASIEKLYFIIYHNQHFVTISNTSLDDLVHLGISQSKISIINPGVNNELFNPSEKTAYPSLVYFGGLRPYKRPEEVLYVLKELRKDIKHLRLTVIGDGPSKSKLENMTIEDDLMDYVLFTGRIPYTKVAEIVSSSWLNIHTSVTEGWGISIIEAACTGTPTVAYKVPGVSDSIEEGKNGILVENGNREDLIDAAKTIIAKPQRWWHSSVEISKKYSWDLAAELWNQIIHETAID